MSSPTQRSLEVLREMGYHAAITERWNQHAKIRQDLFGFIDILAMLPGSGLLAIQTTTGSNARARVCKCMAHPNLLRWLESGGRFEVWSWAKRGARGQRKVWTLRRQRAHLANGVLLFADLRAA